MGRSVLGSRSSHTQKNLHKSIYKSTQLNPQKKTNSKWSKKSLSPPLLKNNWKLLKLNREKKLLLLNLMLVRGESERLRKIRGREKRRLPRRAKRSDLLKNLEKVEKIKNQRNLSPKKLDVSDDELPELPTNEPEVDEPSPNASLLP